MPEKIVSVLYDHYKDSCAIVEKAIKRRDSLMILVIATLGFFSLQGLFPTTSNVLLGDFINFKFGINLNLNFSIIGNVVWFLLLTFTLRYFQTAVFIERQYPYIHKLEERLNKEFDEEVITREGGTYLSNYPLFSDLMWILYTLIFPLILVSVAVSKIISEQKSICTNGWSLSLIFDFTIFIILATSIIFYLIAIHKKPKG